MSAYLSAPYPILAAARETANAFTAAGIIVIASWLEAPGAVNAKWARIDLSDVATADVFVAINPAAWRDAGTGGRHVELGFALALWKPIVLIGQPSNIFHYLREVEIVATVAEAIAAVQRVTR